MFVIRRNDDGKFVTKPGSKHSYTKYLQFAMAFNTQSEAEKWRCVESEYIENVNDIFRSNAITWYELEKEVGK